MEQPFLIETLTLGPLQANCYIVVDSATGQAVVIDPGWDPEHIAARLDALSLTTALLLATHGHFDHVVGVPYLKRVTGAPFWMSQGEWELWAQYAHEHPAYLGLPPTEPVPPPDRFLQEGDEFQVGSLQFQVLSLRGHAPDHIGFLLQAEPLHLFCGDAIFAGSVGRTDIPYADSQTLLEHLHMRVLTLPDDTVLLPGHGPPTTVGIERQTNPFL
jgi:glyoxylase-like metal-dependent hydrolase (beta-lactamase superfamily II)